VLIGGEHGMSCPGRRALISYAANCWKRHSRAPSSPLPCLSPCNIQYRNHTFGQPRGQGYTCEMPYNTWAKWPGKPEGDPAQRLCHLVWNEVVSRGTSCFNFHTWSRNSAGCLFTDDRVPGMRELALAFGNTFNQLRDDHSETCLHGRLWREGRRAALVEMQGQWRIEPDSLARVRDGILNVMVALGMTRRPLALPRPQFAIGARPRSPPRRPVCSCRSSRRAIGPQGRDRRLPPGCGNRGADRHRLPDRRGRLVGGANRRRGGRAAGRPACLCRQRRLLVLVKEVEALA